MVTRFFFGRHDRQAPDYRYVGPLKRSAKAAVSEAQFLFLHLVGDDVERHELMGTERSDQSHVGGIASMGDEDAADAGHVVARVEGVPTPSEIGLEPGALKSIGKSSGGTPISPR